MRIGGPHSIGAPFGSYGGPKLLAETFHTPLFGDSPAGKFGFSRKRAAVT